MGSGQENAALTWKDSVLFIMCSLCVVLWHCWLFFFWYSFIWDRGTILKLHKLEYKDILFEISRTIRGLWEDWDFYKLMSVSWISMFMPQKASWHCYCCYFAVKCWIALSLHWLHRELRDVWYIWYFLCTRSNRGFERLAPPVNILIHVT